METARLIVQILTFLGVIAAGVGLLLNLRTRYWTRWAELSKIVLDNPSLLWLWVTPTARDSLDALASSRGTTLSEMLGPKPDLPIGRTFSEMYTDLFLEFATSPLRFLPGMRDLAKEVEDAGLRNEDLVSYLKSTGLYYGYNERHRKLLDQASSRIAGIDQAAHPDLASHKWFAYWLTHVASQEKPLWVRGLQTFKVDGNRVMGICAMGESTRVFVAEGEVIAGRIALFDRSAESGEELGVTLFHELGEDFMLGVWSGRDDHYRPISSPIILSTEEQSCSELNSRLEKSRLRLILARSEDETAEAGPYECVSSIR